MNQARIQTRVVLAFAACLVSSVVFAQGGKGNRASPAATATGKVKDASITIRYSSPGVKGRKIFGGLVPYGEVWRTGANEATIFETDQDIKVEGKPLPAGKYSLYTIPGENEWTIIFNKQTGQWGISRSGTTRDPAQDALTVQVRPRKSDAITERMVFDINGRGFTLKWENTEVPVSIK